MNKEQEKYMDFLWELGTQSCFWMHICWIRNSYNNKAAEEAGNAFAHTQTPPFAVSCSRSFNFLPQIICDSIFGVVRNALFYVLMCFIVYMCFILRSYWSFVICCRKRVPTFNIINALRWLHVYDLILIYVPERAMFHYISYMSSCCCSRGLHPINQFNTVRLLILIGAGKPSPHKTVHVNESVLWLVRRIHITKPRL
jgi:hypothetical protein